MKDIFERMKKETIDLEKIFIKDIPDKELLFKIYKELFF